MTAGLGAYVEKMEKIKRRPGSTPGRWPTSPRLSWARPPEAAEITGRVFNVKGGLDQRRRGWRARSGRGRCRRGTPEEIGDVLPKLVAEAKPNVDAAGNPKV